MKIHLVIRKCTLSSLAGPDYWGKFALLTGLPLTDDQFLKLIDFYSAAESYKTAATRVIDHADGYGYRFVSEPGSLVVYNHYGVLNPISISKIIRNGSEFNEFVAKKDDLFTALGWSSFEERVSIVETEWDDQNIRFSTEASTYQEIESLYNSAQSLESFLGN